jgi:hypothetical protein
MRRVAVLIGAILLVCGCGGGGGDSDSGAPPLRGYGMVNYWMTLSDSQMDSFFKCLSDNGVGMTSMELFGHEEDGWINKQNDIKARFDVFVKTARRYDVVVFIDMVNWNSESLIIQDDAWFQGWLDFINAYGPSNMIVQAAAESSGEKAERWYQMTENTLTTFALSYNMGSRPTTAPDRYQYVDYHCSSMTDIGPNDGRFIANTDHSTILNEMQDGGVNGQTFNTDKIVEFASPVIGQGRIVNLYGFHHKTYDQNAIRTLGAL